MTISMDPMRITHTVSVHQTGDYEDFKSEYIKELNANSQKVKELINMINSKPCVILYSSKNEKNNSTVLKEYLEQKI